MTLQTAGNLKVQGMCQLVFLLACVICCLGFDGLKVCESNSLLGWYEVSDPRKKR